MGEVLNILEGSGTSLSFQRKQGFGCEHEGTGEVQGGHVGLEVDGVHESLEQEGRGPVQQHSLYTNWTQGEIH